MWRGEGEGGGPGFGEVTLGQAHPSAAGTMDDGSRACPTAGPEVRYQGGKLRARLTGPKTLPRLVVCRTVPNRRRCSKMNPIRSPGRLV